MGSIVKTIGKVVKKIGKTLKKIAPILLVAAAAYVGYGYMTGFQQGGWPQITEWGKNLMGGVSQGQTLSQAATAAGGLPDAGITTPLPDTTPIAEPISGAIDQTIQEAPAWGQEAAMTETAMADSGLLGAGDGMGLPSEGGLLSEIQESTNTRFNKIMDGFVDNMDGTNLGPSVSNYFMSDAQAAGYGPNKVIPGSTYKPELGGASPAYPGVAESTSLSTATDGMGFPGSQMTGTYPGVTTPPVGSHDIGEIPHPQTGHEFVNKMQSFFGKTFGKAWETYKGLWKDNPYLAMYGTSKIIQLVMAAMDDSAEKESYRRRHVMGFAPGNWDDLRKKYGGNLPTSKLSSVWTGEGQRQSSIKTGPKIAGGSRTSAIDRKPQGLVGSKEVTV
jgi:hypothetical protein